MTTQGLGGASRASCYVDAGPRHGKVAWKATAPGLGGGRHAGGLIAADGVIFAAGEVNKGPKPKTKEWPTQAVVHAVDASSGALRWSFKTPTVCGLRSSNLSVHEGLVYFATTLGLHALEAATGKQRWLASSAVDLASRPFVIVDDLVLMPLAEGLGAFDAATGKARWKLAKSTATWLTGTFAALDGLVFFHAEEPEKGGKRRRSLFALDVRAKKPAVRWKAPTFHDGDDSPIVCGDQVLFVDDPGRERRIHAVDARTGQTRWLHTPEGGRNPGLAANDTHCFCAHVDGELAAVSLRDGKVAWTSASGGKPTHSVRRFAVGGDTLFAVRNDDDVAVLLALDARTGKRRWKLDAESWGRWAPAVLGPRLFLQTLEGLVAVE